jgi:succinoglycan biosynthesis transport protein ExoP
VPMEVERSVTDESQMTERGGAGFREVLSGLKRRAWIIVLAIAVCAAGTYAISHSQPNSYDASTSLLVGTVGSVQGILQGNQVPVADSDREIQTKIKLLTTPLITQRAAAAVRRQPAVVAALSSISVAADSKSNLVLVTSSSPDPRAAAAAANAYAAAAISFRRDSDQRDIENARNLVVQQIKRLRTSPQSITGITSGSAKKQVKKLEAQVADLDNLASIQTGNVKVVQRAEVPGAPASPNPKRDAIIGGFAGLLLGLAIALAGEQLDRRVRRSNELESVYDLPLLATIPISPDLHSNGHKLTMVPSGEAEAFQMLRVNLVHPGGDTDKEINSVLVTSASVSDGKSTVALNLAAAAAIAGSRVLLIEADVRAPRFSRLLDLPPENGLATLLQSGDCQVHQVPVGHDPEHGGPKLTMDVIVAGPPPKNPTKLMESRELIDMVRVAEREYDLVVIDAPPASVVSDPIPLAAKVSGVIVVASLRSTTPDGALRLYKQLKRVNAPMLGVVANFASGSESHYYGYHHARA